MDMMDFYTEEQAKEALEDAINTKKEFVLQLEELNTIIFILTYFLETGDPLDPAAFGFEEEEEDDE
jgi:hypothetical protein